MDLNALLGTVLSEDGVGGVSRAASVSGDQTRSVLTSALPLLLGGALNQSTSSSTAAGFAGALTQHSAGNTSNLGAFFSNVDTDDGAKIVEHLLGSNSGAVMSQIAQDSGVSQKDVKKVLASAAPLLMSLLGKEAQSQQAANSSLGVADIMGSLMGGSNASNMLMGLLGGGQSQQGSAASPLMGILGSLLK